MKDKQNVDKIIRRLEASRRLAYCILCLVLVASLWTFVTPASAIGALFTVMIALGCVYAYRHRLLERRFD